MTGVALAKHEHGGQFDADQLALIKSTVAKGTTNDELSLFLYTAKRTGLDPLMKQIHAIKRWSSREGRDVMSIQTGIDGLRLIADRTDRYAPGAEPEIGEDSEGIIKATAYVKKRVGEDWHTIGATAYYEEYVQTNKEGKPIGLWAKMPRLMTAKCAEALALRKAFPAEMSGVYTFDEMTQADSEPVSVPALPPKTPVSTPATASQTPLQAPISPPVTPTTPPVSGEKKDDATLRHEIQELAAILSESYPEQYPTVVHAIQFATAYPLKDGSGEGSFKDVLKLKKWQLEKAIDKLNARLNALPGRPADDGDDNQDIDV
jgi:phage recombination protein Bet